MSEIKRLQKLIKDSRLSLQKYEAALAVDQDDFGAKLMVGNIKRHLADLENQMLALAPSKSQRPALDNSTMAASAL